MQIGTRLPRPAQAPRDLDSVEVGHDHVEDDDVGRLRGQPLERGGPALGEVDDEALEAQGALEGFTDRRLVVDDEDAGRGGAHAP